MANSKNATVIEIKPIQIAKMKIKITGDTPLIMHAWSEKAKREMLDAQMGKAKAKERDKKNPVADFINSMYWLEGKPEIYSKMTPEQCEEAFVKAIENGAKFGFPVTAFKQAAISTAYRFGWSKDKVSLQGAFFIESDENGMIEIKSDIPRMREDMVKVGMGTADIRYRGEFRNWSADLIISYNTNGQYNIENIINIINAGGYGCGIGEWRPEKGGQYGMYHIAVE